MAVEEAKQYIIIKLGDDPYGIKIKYIESIIVMQKITRVPKAQSYFKGVINLRGEVVPVMSLRLKLGLKEAEDTSSTRIIILRPEEQGSLVGIIVDEVKEVISLANADIEKLGYDNKNDKAAYSGGIGKYGDELINILNITSMADQDKQNR
ncbi:MAG: purine-binding chemotaxis protein CheW [Lachnospiraceae bacterium]|jgi:purine-binding chemotaxis protein CheW|nr:purine-binding chemotaxis protein CheW [Lachnospiraceae bacterium]